MRRLTIATIAVSASLLSGAVRLGSPALAQTAPVDGASIAASAKDAAAQLQAYLDKAAKSHDRPDFTKPPASDLFSRIFDFGKLAALPSPSAREIPWLLAWLSAANQANRAIFYFGITPPADLIADRAAMKHNLIEFENQLILASTFMVRIGARETQTMFLFRDQITPEQRTPIREEAFTQVRVSAAETIYGALTTLTSDLKPANERLLTTAIGGTAEVWVKAILSKDRPDIMRQAAKAQSTVKDDKAKQNLAAFNAAMAAAK